MKNLKKRTAVNFNEAFRIIINSTRRLGTERVSIYNNCALNRILAEDIIADNGQPSVKKSLRDGFACRKEDLANELKVIETIFANSLPTKANGLCIPTGVSKISEGTIVDIRLI